MDQAHIEYWAAQEREALRLFRQFVLDNSDTLRLVAHWGDGSCGALTVILREALLPNAGARQRVAGPAKARISAALRTAVLERDKYRCVRCGTHLDLTCDHVIPESLGGPTTLENLQAMCKPCNSSKGIKL